MDKLFWLFLVFIPLTIVGEFLHFSQIWLFFFAALAIIPLAKYIGEATEEFSTYIGSALGGLLNATFGNATELIIGVLAIRAGLLEVVKASITGSIIGNLLLVSGVAMFAGGWRREKQQFNRTAAMASASTLLLAAIALIIPAIFLVTSPAAGAGVVEELSIFVSVFMLTVYVAGLLFILRTHRHLYTEEVGKLEKPR